jgi:DNA repair protein RecO (recombination protein O)
VARLESQLGALSGELVRPVAALAMHDADNLAILNAACALAAGALPEREASPESFAGLLRLLAGIDIPGFSLPELCRWELVLLRELGFGLDLTGGGGNDPLLYVSPRTGRAVTLSQAGEWVERLLPLPAFLISDAEATPADFVAALRLTGHFFARDVFGARHRPLPPARADLYDTLSVRL